MITVPSSQRFETYLCERTMIAKRVCFSLLVSTTKCTGYCLEANPSSAPGRALLRHITPLRVERLSIACYRLSWRQKGKGRGPGAPSIRTVANSGFQLDRSFLLEYPSALIPLQSAHLEQAARSAHSISPLRFWPSPVIVLPGPSGAARISSFAVRSSNPLLLRPASVYGPDCER